MEHKAMKKQILVRLSEEDRQKLDAIVKHHYNNNSNIIRMLINKEYEAIFEK